MSENKPLVNGAQPVTTEWPAEQWARQSQYTHHQEKIYLFSENMSWDIGND